MLTLPKKIRRKPQPYIALRSTLLRRQVKTRAMIFMDEVLEEVKRRNSRSIGPGFFRHLAYLPSGEAEMEFGFFIPKELAPNGPFRSGVAPGGEFISSTFHGQCSDLGSVHSMMRGWMSEVGQPYEVTDDGQSFGCVLTIFHRGPREEPDPTKWVAEVAYKLASSEK